jgi:hypothetical protein
MEMVGDDVSEMVGEPVIDCVAPKPPLWHGLAASMRTSAATVC